MTSEKVGEVEHGSKLRFGDWPYRLLILLLVGIAYGGALNYPFHFDDWAWIVGDESIHSLWPIGGHANRQFLTTTLALNYAAHGLESWGYRLTNVVIHVLGAWLLYAIVLRSLRLPSLGEWELGRARRFAFAVASIWAVHPIQTMAVTYIWQRSESMMGMFFLASVYCLMRMAGGSRPTLWGVGVLVSILLGLATKPVMGVVLPFLVVFDWILLSPSLRDALRSRKWLYATFGVMGLTGAYLLRGTETTSTDLVSSWEYARTQPGVIFEYLGLTVWPNPLCLDWDVRPAQDMQAIALASAALGVLLLGVLYGLRKRSWMGLVGTMFFICLAPSSSFIVINDMKVEYRMYLPLIAVIIFAVAGVGAFLKRKRIPAGPVFGVVLVALILRTVQRNYDYRTNFALWSATVETVPLNGLAHYQLSTSLLREGKHEEALPHTRRAVALRPRHRGGQESLARILEILGDREGAILHFGKVLELRPQNVVYRKRGTLFLELGRSKEALQEFNSAIGMKPDSHRALIGKAQALQQLGRMEKAKEVCRRAINLDKENWEYYNLMGLLKMELRDLDGAAKAYEHALQLNSNDPKLPYRMGQVAAARKRWDDALQYFDQAMGQDPSLANRIGQMAVAVSASSDPMEQDMALRLAEVAVSRTNRRDGAVMASLARVQAALGLRAEANMTYAELLVLPVSRELKEACLREQEAL